MKKKWLTVLAAALMITMVVTGAVPAFAFHEGGLVLLDRHEFLWTDPASGGQVLISEAVLEGAIEPDGTFNPHEMTFRYVVANRSYDPIPGITNGFSGFQLRFPGPVPELHAQTSPTVGGPWNQNAFSGIGPPFGVEWDAPLPGSGIMPGERGVFTFHTAERKDLVFQHSDTIGQGPHGWAHTWGVPIPEPIIDADGTLTGGPGLAVPANIQVQIGSLLTAWPTPSGPNNEGIDWFDNDWIGIGNPRTWTPGDGLHVEGPLYPTAIRNGYHDHPEDPHVVGGMVDAQQVSVDLEYNIDFGGGGGVDPRMKFYDANGNLGWTNGEDIVLDENLDGVFGSVSNSQNFIYHASISVPGLRLGELGIAKSAGHQIAKKVKYDDADGDRIIEVGEQVNFLMVIQVHNPTGNPWTDVIVSDRFGAEIGVSLASWPIPPPPPSGPPPGPTPTNPTQGAATLTTQGNSDKVFLKWEVGTVPAGGTANLVLLANTDLNPAGKQEYTAPGVYEFNSGAVLKFRGPDGKQRSFETGSILVTVVP